MVLGLASLLIQDPLNLQEGGRTPNQLRFLYPALEKEGLLSAKLRYVRLKGVRKLSAYRGVRMVAVKTNIFGGVRPLLSFPEKQSLHSFVRSAEEVLKSPRPFRIKFPHAERPSLARQGPAE